MKNIGKRVKQRREQLEKSQEEVALYCGVSQQALQQLESGATIRPRYLTELAEILKTSTDWLKTGKEEIKDTSNQGRDFMGVLNDINSLPLQDKKKLLAFLEIDLRDDGEENGVAKEDQKKTSR